MSMRSYISYQEGKRVERIDLASSGIYFARGGAVECLTLPEITNPLENDWQEEDGLEVEPSGYILTSPYITLRFIVIGRSGETLKTSLNTLRHILSFGKAVVEPADMHTYAIRHISFEGYKHVGTSPCTGEMKCGEVTVRCQLRESIPRVLSSAYAPTPDPLTHISIDETDLAHYGIQVTSAYDSLLQPADFKEQTLKARSREVSIECLSIGDDYRQVEHHLHLIWKVVDKKQFYLTYDAGKVRCHYTSMTNISELPLTNKKGIAFTLNFKTI